jgi:hypothetical protein
LGPTPQEGIKKKGREAAKRRQPMWDCAAARFTGSIASFNDSPGACAPGFMLPPASRAQSLLLMINLGLAPQALCCHPLRGLSHEI